MHGPSDQERMDLPQLRRNLTLLTSTAGRRTRAARRAAGSVRGRAACCRSSPSCASGTRRATPTSRRGTAPATRPPSAPPRAAPARAPAHRASASAAPSTVREKKRANPLSHTKNPVIGCRNLVCKEICIERSKKLLAFEPYFA